MVAAPFPCTAAAKRGLTVRPSAGSTGSASAARATSLSEPSAPFLSSTAVNAAIRSHARSANSTCLRRPKTQESEPDDRVRDRRRPREAVNPELDVSRVEPLPDLIVHPAHLEVLLERHVAPAEEPNAAPVDRPRLVPDAGDADARRGGEFSRHGTRRRLDLPAGCPGGTRHGRWTGRRTRSPASAAARCPSSPPGIGSPGASGGSSWQ